MARLGVEGLFAQLADSNWDVRRGAAEGLEEIGDARAAEPLTAALADNDGALRHAAQDQIGVEKAAALVTSVSLHGTESRKAVAS